MYEIDNMISEPSAFLDIYYQKYAPIQNVSDRYMVLII